MVSRGHDIPSCQKQALLSIEMQQSSDPENRSLHCVWPTLRGFLQNDCGGDFILKDSWKSVPRQVCLTFPNCSSIFIDFIPVVQLTPLKSLLVSDPCLACPVTLLPESRDRQFCHSLSINLTAFASELPQQQGLRDKQMKNQSDNGVFKVGITVAEDVMASLMCYYL